MTDDILLRICRIIYTLYSYKASRLPQLNAIYAREIICEVSIGHCAIFIKWSENYLHSSFDQDRTRGRGHMPATVYLKIISLLTNYVLRSEESEKCLVNLLYVVVVVVAVK